MKEYKLEFLSMVPRQEYPALNIAEYAEIIINKWTQQGWKLEFINIQEINSMTSPTLTYNLLFSKNK